MDGQQLFELSRQLRAEESKQQWRLKQLRMHPPPATESERLADRSLRPDLHPELRRDIHRDLERREASRHPRPPRAYPSAHDYELAAQDETQRVRQTMYRQFNASKQFEAGVLREAAGAQEARLRTTRATIAELEGGKHS